jgi:hypothetical protein
MRSKCIAWFVVMWTVLPNMAAGQNPAAEKKLASVVERKEAWNDKLESMPVAFDLFANQAAFSSVDQSLKSLIYKSDHLNVHLVFDPQHYNQLVFRFFDKDREIISLRGHRYSSFRVEGDLLFFADYLPDGPGCAIAAYDLTTGKEVWRTTLHQKQPQGASAYRNRVNMLLHSGYALPTQKKKGAGSTLQITGSESYCDYIEVLDAKTGASLAIKHYRVGFRD